MMAKAATALPAEQASPSGTACRITAAEPDVFCAGQRHQTTATEYMDGWFSALQLKELEAHPLLTVERL